MRELFEQLVEVLRVTGEQVAVLLHELLEARVERLPVAPLLQHLVEGVEAGAEVLALLGAVAAAAPASLVELGLDDLLAQPLEELLEVLPRLGRGEVVVLQPVHAGRRDPSGSSSSSACRSPTAFSVTSRRRSSPELARFLLELVERLDAPDRGSR